MAAIGEKIREGFGLFGGLHVLLETFGKFNQSLPPEWKQKLPGFLGLSLADEQIVNGLIRSLKKKDANFEETKEPDIEKQAIIFKFLNEKCKWFEQYRFINVVAGMEVKEAKPPAVPGYDRRREFLDVFGTILLSYKNFDLAYEECVGGRIIIKNPIHQKALHTFAESVQWFKTTEWSSYASSACEKATKELRSINIGKEHDGFWRAAFPKKRWAIAFKIFAVIVIAMFAYGIFS